MKKLLVFAACFMLCLSAMSQGNNKGKGNGKKGNGIVGKKSGGNNNGHYSTNTSRDADFEKTIWGGTNYPQGKFSKNQPAKVRESFSRDYPNAGNVNWTKYRGDWTATFGNGIFGSRTVVYHASGQRKDLRSVINRNQLPGNRSVWDQIFKRNNISNSSQVVQIERPGISGLIYRLWNRQNYFMYNQSGQTVQYDY